MLAPTTPDHSIARWLSRVGGSSGWVLSTQVPSLDGLKERAAEHGVRIAVQTQAMGHGIIQLHPLDVGVLLELDAFMPRQAWFWDDMPAAQAAQASRSTKADDILAVDVAVEDPAAMAATWAAIIGLEPPPRPRRAPPSPSAAASSVSYPPPAAHRHRRRRCPRHRPRACRRARG